MNRLFLLLLTLLAACQSEPSAPDAAAKTPEIDSVTGAPVAQPNPWLNAGCTLVTDEEVEALFGIVARDVTLNTRSLPDEAFCLRTWNKPDWKERENNNEKPGATYQEPQNRLIIKVLNYHTETTARQQFDLAKTARRDTYEEDVAGLGDDAVWSTSTSTLLVKKGHLVLHLSLEHTDTPHDNLAKAKEVALVALKKM